MSRFEVSAPSMGAVAASCDAVADALTRIATAVRAQGHPDTGRGPSTAQVGDVVDELIAALKGLGTAALADGDALREAAATYVRADGAAVRTR